MPAKIRLQRQGRKFQSIYSIVVADSRAPRDGKFIETLGQYNPNTNPATIILDFNKALEWLQKGAQPTDTCRAILSYKGVLYKKHLLEGVKKNAFSEEEAVRRFQEWFKQKEAKIEAKRETVTKKKADLEKEHSF
jgi:small subunit ribosomal protein S16